MTNVDPVSIENNEANEVRNLYANTATAVKEYMATGYKATTREIAAATGINLLTVRPAVTKLVKAGKLFKSGKVNFGGVSENTYTSVLPFKAADAA